MRPHSRNLPVHAEAAAIVGDAGAMRSGVVCLLPEDDGIPWTAASPGADLGGPMQGAALVAAPRDKRPHRPGDCVGARPNHQGGGDNKDTKPVVVVRA